MGIIGINPTNTSISDSKNDTKKPTIKTNDSSNTEKAQEKPQSLGTDSFVKSSEDTTKAQTYKPVKKKLSAEEVDALKEEQNNTKAELVKKFISDTINNQNRLLGKSTDAETPGMSKETSDLLTKIFGSTEKAYPPLATTPEDAEKAISDGGAYSINAVADRIMTMATYIAGDDPAKLQDMRDAVEKGFSAAGLDFKKATNSKLPQICEDTHTEIMKRFDELQKKYSSTDEKNETNSN